jgi:aminoglycoside phosphotransferase
MKIELLQKSLPPALTQAVSGYAFRQIHLGLSPSKVFRLEAKNKKSLYLKIAPRVPGFSLFQEKLKLNWLENRIPVPKVMQFYENQNTDYLLLSEISGLPASDNSLKDNVSRVIEQMVNGLKQIHELPVKKCPFDERMNYKIELVRERIAKNLIDIKDFEEEHQGKTAEDMFERLLSAKPEGEDLVFTHGDYCVPNVILENGKLSGFVDWGNAGVADRYQDVALLTRSISHNFDDGWEKKIFEIYGIEPDPKKIEFYKLLDEFF